MTLSTACGNDDDTPDDNTGKTDEIFDIPAMAAHTALFQVTSSDSDYKSIELTESGCYIITAQNSPYYAPSTRKSLALMYKKHNIFSRAGHIDIIDGKYTVNNDGSYDLIGFGTLTVNMDNNGTVNTLVIIFNDGNSTQLPVNVKKQYAESDMTVNLCRAWDFESFNLKVDLWGYTFFNKTYKKDQMDTLGEDVTEALKEHSKKLGITFEPEKWSSLDYEDEYANLLETMPEYMVYTKAGTYFIKYSDGKSDISSWAWVDQASGRIRYSWNLDDLYDDEESGEVTLNLTDGHMSTIEAIQNSWGSNDETKMMETITWNFTQAK